MQTKYVIILIVIVGIFSFSFGIILNNGSSSYIKFAEEFFTIPKKSIDESTVYNQDVTSLIHISNKSDILTKRNLLIDFLWNDKSTLNREPDQINLNISDTRFSNISNLQSIDEFQISMDYGFNSIAYMFHPVNSNNKLIIYHQGHDGDFDLGFKTIEFFLKENYTVLAFSMPLYGQNNQPIIDHTIFGKIQFISHKQFILLENDSFTPMKLFFEPIYISLNYVDNAYNFSSYDMVGISGGGWTTTLYSAIDERIRQSFSVAGTYPIFLRNESSDIGDYEQINPLIYTKANYLELYILASVGDDRKHTQIFINNDPCCFGGNKHVYYQNIIKNKTHNLGGSFEIIIDESINEHRISDNILNYIDNSIKYYKQ